MKNKNNKNRKASALLIVLFIVMAITILSLGFLSKSNVELACGENMILRTKMDYLAESALEHAKGLVLNPQDLSAEYWTGANAQQLVTGSEDYYDVNVLKTDLYNYQINCTAYREKDGEQIARSRLGAELRLDPFIAYYQKDKRELWREVTINGDAYFADEVLVFGKVYGDVYSSKTITKFIPGYIEGRQYESFDPSIVSAHGLSVSDFSPNYYIGSIAYTAYQIPPGAYESINFVPIAGNPAGVFYCNGNLDLTGTCSITGMLVVKDDLIIRQGGQLTITSVKNFPALLVGHDIRFEDDNCTLNVTGLVEVEHHIDIKNKVGGVITILGSLYVMGDGIIDTVASSVTVTGSQEKAAIETWPNPGSVNRWAPAMDAFFKSIERK